MTGSWDKTARVWDVETGKELVRFAGHSVGVNVVAWSPDGLWIVTGSTDHTARVWEAKTGREVARLGHSGVVWAAAWSPDGRRVVTGSEDKTARVWEAATGKELLRLKGHMAPVKAVMWSPDGGRLATGSGDDTCREWEAETGKELVRVEGFSFGVNATAWSPKGKRIVTVGKTPQVWEADSGREVARFLGHSAPVLAVAWSPDGRRIVTGGDDKTACMWEAETGKELGRLEGYSEPMDVVAWAADGRRAVIGSFFETGRMWDMETGRSIEAGKVAQSADWRRVITGSWKVKMFKTSLPWRETDRDLGLQMGHSFLVKVYVFAYSPDGSRVVGGGLDNTAVVRVAGTGKELMKLTGHSDSVVAVAWSPDGRRIVTGSEDKTARVWEVETGREVAQLEGHSSSVSAVGWSPDGRHIVTGSDDKTARVWEAETGRELVRMEGHSSSVSAVGWSPDGQRIVTGSSDNTARVWEAETGKLLNICSGHLSTVVGLSIHPKNNRLLLTISNDGTTRLWDMENGNELCQMISFKNGDWIVVAPDGRFDTNNLEDIKGVYWLIRENGQLTTEPPVTFARQYYEPRLLARIMGGEKFEPVKNILELNRTKPLVKITDLAPDSEDTVKVTVEVGRTKSDLQKKRNGKFLETGVFDVRLFRDRQLVGYAPETDGEIKVDERTGKQTLTFSKIKLPVKPDVKQVEFSAYAFNVDRLKSETDRKIFDIPTKLTPHKGRAYVITVGVNAQENPRVPWLRYTASDVRLTEQMLTERLKAMGEYSEVVTVPLLADYELEVGGRIVLLETANPEEFKQGKKVLKETTATKQNFQTVLNLLGGKKVDPQLVKGIPNAEQLREARPEDLVVIFFSSHGDNDRGLFYLVPYDTGESSDLTDIHRHCISSDELTAWMRDVDGGEMVMIIDACYASAVVGTGFKPGPMGSRGLGQLSYDKGMRILAATQASNEAREGRKEIKHGLLTEALLNDGIKAGKADWEPVDKQIFGKEWLDYGVKRVPELFEQEFGNPSKPNPVNGKPNPETGPSKRLVEEQIQKEIQERQIQKPSLLDFTRKKRDFILVKQ